MELETLRSTTERSAPATGFVRRLTLTVLFAFLTLTLVVTIAWLVLDPHDPGFRVSSLAVSNFTVSDSQLGGKFDIELTLRNPNRKIEVVVDRFNVWVVYGEMDLAGASVQQQTIPLGKMRDQNLKVELGVRGSGRKAVPEDLIKDWNKRVVNFNVNMMVRVRFEDGIWPTKEKFLVFLCEDLDVGFFSSKDTGKLLGIGKDCHV